MRVIAEGGGLSAIPETLRDRVAEATNGFIQLEADARRGVASHDLRSVMPRIGRELDRTIDLDRYALALAYLQSVSDDASTSVRRDFAALVESEPRLSAQYLDYRRTLGALLSAIDEGSAADLWEPGHPERGALARMPTPFRSLGQAMTRDGGSAQLDVEPGNEGSARLDAIAADDRRSAFLLYRHALALLHEDPARDTKDLIDFGVLAAIVAPPIVGRALVDNDSYGMRRPQVLVADRVRFFATMESAFRALLRVCQQELATESQLPIHDPGDPRSALQRGLQLVTILRDAAGRTIAEGPAATAFWQAFDDEEHSVTYCYRPSFGGTLQVVDGSELRCSAMTVQLVPTAGGPGSAKVARLRIGTEGRRAEDVPFVPRRN